MALPKTPRQQKLFVNLLNYRNNCLLFFQAASIALVKGVNKIFVFLLIKACIQKLARIVVNFQEQTFRSDEVLCQLFGEEIA